jgi:methylated-DNA-[protein]-cysteine S-methyltransferase
MNTAMQAELLRRAQEEGLIDVAYTTLDGPLGTLLLATTDRGLVRVAFANESEDDVLQELSDKLSPRVLESPARLDGVRRELTEYLEGSRRKFDLPLDWRLVRSDFSRRVLEATDRIPYGVTSTYRDVADAAGNVKAVRATGSALGSNPIPIVVPCHRVLRTGGDLGGYGGTLPRKVFLLDLEAGRPHLV